MVRDLAYTLILGKPLIMYGGILTFILLISTATVGWFNFKAIYIIPFKWHPRLAITTIVVAILHAILGLSAYFNF